MDQNQRLDTSSRLNWIRFLAAGVLLWSGMAAGAPSALEATEEARWDRNLERALERIDEAHGGELGVYVKDLSSGVSVSLRGDESWYLASGIKVPVAIAVMQDIERGKYTLDTEVRLAESDFVDGAGQTNWKSPGSALTVRYLLDQMLIVSDNTASDMLIRLVGLEQVNTLAQGLTEGGMGPVTTLADVRRYAYSQFHADAFKLSGRDFFTIRNQTNEGARIEALANVLDVPAKEFALGDLESAFSAYYATNLNSGRLSAFGNILEALVNGEVLGADASAYLQDVLLKVKTGDRRIKGGLPNSVAFAHKTGTQYRRACDMGVVMGKGESPTPTPRVLIAACSRGFHSLADAESAFQAVGEAVSASGVLHLSKAPAQRLPSDLKQKINDIDAGSPGGLGVYVKHLGTGEIIRHRSHSPWYLSSLVKVPVAIAVLQAVEEGRLSLDDQLTLKKSDFVDGAGDLLWQEVGTRYTLGTLIGKSLENSDSTATDMLMRHLGVDAFNQQIKEAMVAEGLAPFTTILQVRYDAYSELHPDASELSNMDYIEIRSAGSFAARIDAFKGKLGVDADELRAASLEEAFEQYYQRGLNSGTLDALGGLLERLVRGELLGANHTDRLLGHMERITTGDKRLSSGFSKKTPFAQKTGTQVERACNMGVTHPRSIENAVVVVACAQNFGDLKQAERMFQEVAKAVQAGQNGAAVSIDQNRLF